MSFDSNLVFNRSFAASNSSSQDQQFWDMARQDEAFQPIADNNAMEVFYDEIAEASLIDYEQMQNLLTKLYSAPDTLNNEECFYLLQSLCATSDRNLSSNIEAFLEYLGSFPAERYRDVFLSLHERGHENAAARFFYRPTIAQTQELLRHLVREPLTVKQQELYQTFFSRRHSGLSLSEIVTRYSTDPMDALIKIFGKEAIQEYLESKLDVWLQKLETAEIPLDIKMFAHVFGDSFIINSDLEGNHIQNTVHYLIQIITYCNHGNGLDSLLKDFHEIHEWATLIKAIDQAATGAKEKKLSSLSFEVSKNLKSKGRVVLPGGWRSGYTSGHVMIYEIEKEPSGFYKFSIFNSGAGLNYHAKASRQRAMKVCPLFSLSKIEPATIETPDFFSQLLGLQIKFGREDDQVNQEDIYQLLFYLFPEAVIDDYSSTTHDKLMSAQTAGVCSYESLIAYMRIKLPLKQFLQLKFSIRFTTLGLWYLGLQSGKNSGVDVSFVTGQALSRFTSAIRKNLKRPSGISDEQIMLGCELIKRTKPLTGDFQTKYTLQRPRGKARTAAFDPIPNVKSIRKIVMSSKSNQKMSSSVLENEMVSFKMDEHGDLPIAKIASYIKWATIRDNKGESPVLAAVLEVCKIDIWAAFSSEKVTKDVLFDVMSILENLKQSRHGNSPKGILLSLYLHAIFILLTRKTFEKLYGNDIAHNIDLVHPDFYKWSHTEDQNFAFSELAYRKRFHELAAFFRKERARGSSFFQSWDQRNDLFSIELAEHNTAFALADRLKKKSQEATPGVLHYLDGKNVIRDFFNELCWSSTPIPNAPDHMYYAKPSQVLAPFFTSWVKIYKGFASVFQYHQDQVFSNDDRIAVRFISRSSREDCQQFVNLLRSFKANSFPLRTNGNIEFASAISYFEANINVFFTAEGRDCFRNYLFDFIRLKSIDDDYEDYRDLTTLIEFELKSGDNSPVRYRLFNLLSVVRDLALQNGNLDVVIFLIELDNAFAEISDIKRILNPDHYDSIKNKGSVSQQIACGLHFLKLFREAVDWRFAKLLFNLSALVHADSDYDIEKGTLRKISEENKDKLRDLISRATPEEKVFNLRECFSCFELQLIAPIQFEKEAMRISSGNVEFSIITGQLFVSGERIIRAPEEIGTLDIVKKLNNGKSVLDFRAVSNGFISSAAGISTFFLYKDSPKLGLIIDNEKMFERLGGALASFDKKNLEKLTRFLYCSVDQHSLLGFEIAHLVMRFLPCDLTETKRYEHWLGCGENDASSMFIIDHQENRVIKIVFKAEESVIINLATNEQLVRPDLKNIEADSPLYLFRDIIDRSLIWADPSGTISSVEFSDFGLTFDYKDKNEFREYSGYSVCYGEECPIPNMRSAIYLKDQRGNELVVIPWDTLTYLSNEKSVAYEFQTKRSNSTTRGHHAFFRKPSERYFSAPGEGLLDLVRLMIYSFNYREALEYLKRSFNPLTCSQNYLEKLIGLLDLNSYKAQTTELYAILMHIVWMGIELTIEDTFFCDQADLIYRRYIHHYNHLKYRLSLQQEVAIAMYFEKIAPRYFPFIRDNHLRYFKNKDNAWLRYVAYYSSVFIPLRWETGFEKMHKPCHEFGLDLGFKASRLELDILTSRESIVLDSFGPNSWDSQKNDLAQHLFRGIKNNDQERLWALRFTLFKHLYGFNKAEKRLKENKPSKKIVTDKFACVAMLLLTENFLDPAFYASRKKEFLKLIRSSIKNTDMMPDVIDHYWPLLVEKLNVKLSKQQEGRKLGVHENYKFNVPSVGTESRIVQYFPGGSFLWPRISLNVRRFALASELFKQKEGVPRVEEPLIRVQAGNSGEDIGEPAFKKVKQHSFEGESEYELFEELISNYFDVKHPTLSEFPLRERGVTSAISQTSLFKNSLRQLEFDFISYQKHKRYFVLKANRSLEEIKQQIEESMKVFSEQAEGLKRSIDDELFVLLTLDLTPKETLASKILIHQIAFDTAFDFYAFSQAPESGPLKNLYKLTSDYVVAMNRILALKLALTKISEHKLCDDQRRPHLEHELAEILQSPLFFSKVMMHPIVLYFQYKTGKVLRPKQLEFFSRAIRSTKEVFQLGCGEGKTKVLTVLMSLYLSSQNRQVINIVPSSNFTTNYTDLQEQYLNITEDFVTVFQFSRDNPLTPKNIREYSAKVRNSFENRGVIISEPQTLQSLQLKYLEHLHKLTLPKDKTLEPFFKQYDEILNSFMFKGVAIVDEVHQVFEPLKDLNYSLEDAKVLSSFHFEIPGVLIRCAFEIISEGGEFTSEALMNPLGRSLFIDKLAEKIVERRSEFYLPFENQELELFFACLRFNRMATDPDSEIIRKNLVPWFDSLSETTKNRVLLLRAHLHVYLPHCLSLRCYVDYGRSENSQIKFAVPYTANMKPAANSYFECVETLVNCTYLLYLKEGLTLSQISELLSSWQRQDAKMRLSAKSENERSISQRFSKKWNEQPLQSIDLSNSFLLKQLHEVFAKDAEACMEYVATFVISQFSTQEYKLSSNAQDIGRTLFSKLIGFSGTPSNFLTYPVEMELRQDSEAHGEMLELLTRRDVCTLEICEAVDLAALAKNEGACLILDPAAYFEGLSNEEVAKRILIGAPLKIRAVLHFDSQSNKMVLQFKDGSCQEFQDNLSSMDERITYLDQQHVTGVDTSQPMQGTGYLVLNKGLMITDLFQSAKRLRGLGTGQKIQFIVPASLCDEMTQVTGHLEITQETVILWALINEVTALSRMILPSLLSQIHNIYRTQVFKLLIQATSLEEKSSLYREYKELLLTKINHEEFRDHGSFFPPEMPITIVIMTLEAYEKTYGKIADVEMKRTLAALLDRANEILPVRFSDAIERSLDVTAVQEQEQSGEIEVESQIQRDKVAYEEIRWDPKSQLQHLLSRTIPPRGAFELFNSEHRSIFCEALNISIPEVGFNPRIFITQNFLSRKVKSSSKRLFMSDGPAGYDLFLRALPKIQFFAVLRGVNEAVDFANYWVLSTEEAAIFRERLVNRKIELIPPYEISLYDARGDLWGGINTKFDDLERVAIVTQLQFLNSETHFSGLGEKFLSEWIASGRLDEKLTFFHRRRNLMKNRETLPAFEGSVLQRLFKGKG